MARWLGLVLSRLAVLTVYIVVSLTSDLFQATDTVHARHTLAPSLLLSPTVNGWTRALPVLLALGAVAVRASTPGPPTQNTSRGRQSHTRLLAVAADISVELAVCAVLHAADFGTIAPCCPGYQAALCATVYAAGCAGNVAIATQLYSRLSLATDLSLVERIHDRLHDSLHLARAFGYAVAAIHVLALAVGNTCQKSVLLDDIGEHIKNCGYYTDFQQQSNITNAAVAVGTTLSFALLLNVHAKGAETTLDIDVQLQPFGAVIALWTCDAAASNRASEITLVLTSVCGCLLMTSAAANAVNVYVGHESAPPAADPKPRDTT